MTELLIRALSNVQVDAETGIVEGIAVPWDEPADIGMSGYRERFERGSITDDGNVKLFSEHRQIVGRVIESEDRPEGFWVRAKISDTAAGRDLLALIRDGAIDKFSIGFLPSAHRIEEDGTVVRTAVFLKEVSAVIWSAYDGAEITDVRHDTKPQTEGTAVTDTNAPTALELETRAALETLTRKVETLALREPEPIEILDTRSAAEILQALVFGDAETITEYEALLKRAYSGGTTADNGSTLKPGWVGDLTRIIDSSSGVLASILSSGVLPDKGMNLEYAELATNTVAVAEQANEGDDLAQGKVTLTSRTTPVRTFGGYSTLTRQEIERSTLPILQRHLEAQSLAAGADLKRKIRTAFNALVAARVALANDAGVVTLGATLTAGTYANWVDVIVDGAVRYSQNDLSLETLVTSPSVFKRMAKLTGSDNRPMMSLDGSGANTVGRLNIKALNGELLGVPVVLDPDATGDAANFVDSRALRVYASGVAQLSDENVVNLSKTFSVYRYAAFAPEIPAGLVPIKFAA